MEILVGLALIIVLLICLGVEWGFITLLLFGIIGIVMAALSLFFVVCLIMTLCAQRVTGEFSEIRERENGFPQVWYTVGGEEYANLFPCEVILRDKIYVKDKPVKLRVLRKQKLAFDRNAVSAIAVGVVFCIPTAVWLLWYVSTAFGI